ncbi:hypothetical protein VNO78_15451 [Psophocarpus tetragonolobus]|uniref:Uncharacterized protein n=1 Tax=Psophocarpus tetragonolobus TaxID=3891 RepID=A0AAN9SF14_PSOTE
MVVNVFSRDEVMRFSNNLGLVHVGLILSCDLHHGPMELCEKHHGSVGSREVHKVVHASHQEVVPFPLQHKHDIEGGGHTMVAQHNHLSLVVHGIYLCRLPHYGASNSWLADGDTNFEVCERRVMTRRILWRSQLNMGVSFPHKGHDLKQTAKGRKTLGEKRSGKVQSREGQTRRDRMTRTTLVSEVRENVCPNVNVMA